jgi:chromosome segregation ATPase
MLNPLQLPADLAAALRAVPEIQRMLERRLGDLERQMGTLPERLEATLRGHFHDQREGIDELRPLLADNRDAAQTLPGKVDALREELGAARGEIRGLRSDFKAAIEELATVRETVEPLRGPAERVARLSDRLPGQG